MKKTITILAALFALLAATALTACDPVDTTNKLPSENSSAASAAGPKWVNQDGTYKVGTGADEIPMGTYNLKAAENSFGGGYVELCSNANCDIESGMIKNETVPAGGNAMIEITNEVTYVKLQGVVVEKN